MHVRACTERVRVEIDGRVRARVKVGSRHAKDYKLDPGHLGATGFSAGGHLSLMLGVTSPDDGLEGDAPSDGPSTRVQAVDTTGAGDAFVGNLACRLERGEDLKSAAAFACYAASLSVTRHGAQPAMPGSDETKRFMEGFRS